MRRRFLLIALGLLVAGLFGGAAVGAEQVVVASARPHIAAHGAEPRRDVAIVLGAGMAAPGRPGPVLQDRLALALDLYERGRVERILVSGDNDGRGIDEVNAMREWLVTRGVPPADVYMDHAGFRTHDTMQRAAQVFAVRRAIVCTQAFHLPRSVFLARHAGIDAIGVAAPPRRWHETRSARLREGLARVKAVADIALGVEPRFLGERIPIGEAPASATYDGRS